MRKLMALTVLATIPASPLQGSSPWAWDGETWADYRPFMSPITVPVKSNLRTILADGVAKGRVAGRMGQLGDSITNASPYFRNAVLNGPQDNATGHDYAGIRSWLAYSGAMPADVHSFYRDHGKETPYGNASGWTVADAEAANHPTAAVTIGDGVTPGDFSWALMMFGTNDIDDGAWDPATWATEYGVFIQESIDLGVIPVLSTLPPEQEHLGDGRVEAANTEIRSLAQEMHIPYVDLYELILAYQPVNWVGTLIGADGTHPSAGGGGRDFSQAGLTESDGYAARTKLTFDLTEKLKSIVFENGSPEPAENEVLADDFESGDLSSWSNVFPESAVHVSMAAASAGGFGLEVTLDGCTPADRHLSAPTLAIGSFTSCERLAAGDIEVLAPGATFTSGLQVDLQEGFSVGPGADFSAHLVGELAEPFAWVEDDSPLGLASYEATFYLNLDDVSLADGDTIDILVGLAEDGSVLFRVTAKHNATFGENRLLLAARRDDGTYAGTPFGQELLFPSEFQVVDLSWKSGDDDGFLLVAIGSTPLSGLENLTNTLGLLDAIRLGATGGTLTNSSGVLSFDDFQSFQ